MTENPEACPGCGCEPGDGITKTCNHPEGCGFYKAEEREELERWSRNYDDLWVKDHAEPTYVREVA